ncbi:MAG: hypothetical protein WAZ18_01190 [Alphaproteobacteria bacterium]
MDMALNVFAFSVYLYILPQTVESVLNMKKYPVVFMNIQNVQEHVGWVTLNEGCLEEIHDHERGLNWALLVSGMRGNLGFWIYREDEKPIRQGGYVFPLWFQDGTALHSPVMKLFYGVVNDIKSNSMSVLPRGIVEQGLIGKLSASEFVEAWYKDVLAVYVRELAEGTASDDLIETLDAVFEEMGVVATSVHGDDTVGGDVMELTFVDKSNLWITPQGIKKVTTFSRGNEEMARKLNTMIAYEGRA